VLKEFGIGALEDLDEPPIDLKEIESFGETGLNAEKLAGSALRRATIRILSRRVKEASVAIEEIQTLANELNESAGRKAGMLRSTADAAAYRKIDTLIERVKKAKSIQEIGDEELAALTPKGTLEIAAEESVVDDIRGEMGVLKLEDSKEDYASRSERIGRQFEVLASLAKNFWAWEKIRGEAPHKDALTDAYRQQADFRVIPATEDTPAPSYGIEFKIVHKESEEEVVSFRYSLARTFSENQSPEKIKDFFEKHIRTRGLFSVSKLYLDRARRALEAKVELGVRVPTPSIALGTKRAEAGINMLFSQAVPRKAAYVHYQNKRSNLRSLERQLSETSLDGESEWVDDTIVDEEIRVKRKFVGAYREFCRTTEDFVPPPLSTGLSRSQLESIHISLTQLRGVQMVFDYDKENIRITKNGIVGLGASTLNVSLADFKRTYEDKGGDIAHVLQTYFPNYRPSYRTN